MKGRKQIMSEEAAKSVNDKEATELLKELLEFEKKENEHFVFYRYCVIEIYTLDLQSFKFYII